MSSPDSRRHIEIKDGDQTVAGAEVTTSRESAGTAQASLHAAAGHIAPGRRASLVDAVMDLPEVRDSERLEAAVPLGDGESLERLRERTEDATTRPAGSTALVDAKIPPARPHAGSPSDTGPSDTGLADTGLADTGLADTGLADTGLADTGLAEAGPAENEVPGAGQPDPGPLPGGAPPAG